ARQTEQFSNACVFDRQVVPQLDQALCRKLECRRNLSNRGDSSRGKQRDSAKAVRIFQVQQQRRALVQRKLFQLFPQPLQKDLLLDSPCWIRIRRRRLEAAIVIVGQ